LDRTDRHTRFGACAYFDVIFCEFDHFVPEMIIDLLMDIDSFWQRADLPRIEEAQCRDLWHNFVDFYIFTDNGWVVALNPSLC